LTDSLSSQSVQCFNANDNLHFAPEQT
jgi:hypothetical protein